MVIAEKISKKKYWADVNLKTLFVDVMGVLSQIKTHGVIDVIIRTDPYYDIYDISDKFKQKYFTAIGQISILNPFLPSVKNCLEYLPKYIPSSLIDGIFSKAENRLPYIRFIKLHIVDKFQRIQDYSNIKMYMDIEYEELPKEYHFYSSSCEWLTDFSEGFDIDSIELTNDQKMEIERAIKKIIINE
jgi:hypothetical protein